MQGHEQLESAGFFFKKMNDIVFVSTPVCKMTTITTSSKGAFFGCLQRELSINNFDIAVWRICYDESVSKKHLQSNKSMESAWHNRFVVECNFVKIC